MRVSERPGWAGTRASGGDDAGEVEGIDGGEAEGFAGVRISARAAEGVDGVGEGELLAGEAGHEASAADIAAGFEASQGTQHIAPGETEILPSNDIAKDYAVAVEKSGCDGFGDLVRVDAGGGRLEGRPAARGSADGEAAGAAGVAPAAAAGAGPTRSNGAKALIAVGGDAAGGDQVAQAVLDIGGQPPGAHDDLFEEKSAALAQQSVDGSGGAGEFRGLGFRIRAAAAPAGGLQQQVKVFAEAESYGRGTGCGSAAAVGVGVTFAEAAPDYVAGEAEFVQPLGAEAPYAGGKDGALPGSGGHFEALQALDGAPEAGLAVQGVAGRGVLPADEEAHEVADGDRLDFAAQAVEG